MAKGMISKSKMLMVMMDSVDEISIKLPKAINLTIGSDGGFRLYSAEEESVELAQIQVIVGTSLEAWEIRIRVKAPIDVTCVYWLVHRDYEPKQVTFRKILDDSRYVYTRDDLGAIYSSKKTQFRLWAPMANRVELIIYEQGDTVNGTSYEMKRDQQGTWVVLLAGDWHGKFYTYRVHVHDQVREAVDPYAKSVNVNGTKGAIIDLARTNPEGWGTVGKPVFNNFVDAVIYETHIRDLSISVTSGIKQKGKYLGLTEENTQSPAGLATGISHLKELGITHLHLLPVMESEFIHDDQDHYNWGYGTNFFFATEGQYTTEPTDPVKRIQEFKAAVQALHKNGIRVILDVVYNHIGRIDADLERIVPGYYLRRDDDGNLYAGSGVNNDFASERPMARKLLIDSVKYWVTEYRVDGYRFDLMGLHDRETMLQLIEELHQIDPTILVYGEAWLLETGLPFEKLMVKNAQQGTAMGIFNDNVRDAIASGGLNPVTEKGFVSGKIDIEPSIKKTVVGSIHYDSDQAYNVEYHHDQPNSEIIETIEPHESINYVTSHDNHALRDRLEMSNPEATEEERERMTMLANGIILTSQGIPFLAGGVEIHKTKFGDENSYQSPDRINELDWSYKEKYQHIFQFYQGLIQLRKEHPAFRMSRADLIRKHLVFESSPKGTVAFSLIDHANGDTWKQIFVVYNQNTELTEVSLPVEGTWQAVVDGEKTGVTPISIVEGKTVDVPPIGMLVLYQH